jgi:hypothetical protein
MLVDSQIENRGGSPVGRRVKGFDTLPYPMGEPLLLDEAALSQIPEQIGGTSLDAAVVSTSALYTLA